MNNVVYFDIETQKSFDEVGGRNPEKFPLLKVSVAVTCSSGTGEYRVYHERTIDEMIKQLMRADLVVGHNIVDFDYRVLSAYTPLDLTQIPTLDTMQELQKQGLPRVSLDDLAKTTLGETKTAEGLAAIRWWKEGTPDSILKIAEYCCYDVKLCKMLHEYGRKWGKIYFVDRMNNKRTVPVKWDA